MRKLACLLVFLLSCTGAPASTPAAIDAQGRLHDAAGSDAQVDVLAQDVLSKDGQDAKTKDSALDVADVPKPDPLPAPLPPGVQAILVSSGLLDSQGKSADSKVQLSADAVSFLAVVLGKHPGFFSLATIVGPDGTPYAKGQCIELCLGCKNRVGASPAIGAALLPSSSGVQAGPGTWHLGSCGFAWHKAGNVFAPGPLIGAFAQTVAFVRTTPAGKVPGKARIRLRLFFTGAGGVTASTAWNDPRITGLLAEAGKLYAAIGVTLEVVDVRDTAPGHTVIVLPEDVTVSGQSDLDDLFAQALPAEATVATLDSVAAVDIFFVDMLVGGGVEGKGVVGGVAGGIPGPAFYHGVPRSGVAIALGPLGKDAILAGRTVAHELGHFLGLWHPSEREGMTFDPLDDTPQCGQAQDANKDGLLDAAECKGKGDDEVMFWFAGAAQALFTQGQGAIVRAHPLAYDPSPVQP